MTRIGPSVALRVIRVEPADHAPVRLAIAADHHAGVCRVVEVRELLERLEP